MFSYGSSSSTSRAMVTPSLVMLGAPHALSRTTLRPFGPRVTLTVSANLSTPACSARRASSLNSSCLANCAPYGSFRKMVSDEADLFFDDSQHVTSGQHQVFLATVFNFGSAVFGVQHDVTFGDIAADAFAVVSNAARDYGDDFSFLWFLLSGVWNDQAGSSGLLGGQWFNYDAVLKRLDGDSHESLLLTVKGKYSCIAGQATRRRGCRMAGT